MLAAGAWTRDLGRSAGVELPVCWVHGEAMITEPLGPVARHAMASAGFFDETGNPQEQVVSFTLHQHARGNVMLGEAAAATGRLGRRVSLPALPAIAGATQRFFPGLRRAAVMRGWAIPVAYVDDNRPLLGPVPELDGLLVAAGFKSTIVLTPLVGELVAAMITGRPLDPRLAEFSPARPL